MKFMKLGSKPDAFQTDGNDVRYVAAELATDLIINVGDVKFYLHKFPLLSKSARLQKLVAITKDENEEIIIPDIPGGSEAFEICAKFCYGMKVTLNAYNVVSVRCAAEYLEMQETVEKGNLIYKIDVFLDTSLLRSWKDSIIVLQTTKSLKPWPEDLKVVSRCIDSIASIASIHPSKVEWSYTYNRKNSPSEIRIEPQWNGVKQQPMVPKDWWVEDLCELEIDFFKRVVQAIKIKGKVSSDIIGEALRSFALKRMPSFSKSSTKSVDFSKYQMLVETIVWLLPIEIGSVPCSFLLKLLKAAILLDSGEKAKRELVKRIGRQLEEASVADLLLPAPPGEITLYDVDVIQNIVEEFAMQEQGMISDNPQSEDELQEIRSPTFISDKSKLLVAKLVDGYLTEISKDRNLPLSKFTSLAQLVSGFPRPVHDRLYRAIDMYLKEHPLMNKSERKKICRLMNCKKLSADASMHAVQNERLPLRVVVQVLFFEQIRASNFSNGGIRPDLPSHLRDLVLPVENGGSNESSRTATTNTEEDWDSVPTVEDLKVLQGELATLKFGSRRSLQTEDKNRNSLEKASGVKVQGSLVSKKMFTKLWSSKGQDENSSTDTSGSPGSGIKDEAKLTPSRNRRYSVS